MTVIGHRGQVVHHDNCTYCTYRRKYPAPKGSKAREIEMCDLTNQILSPPTNPVGRTCEHYRQEGCDCSRCQGELINIGILRTRWLTNEPIYATL